jgi:uncharacterized protein Veg
MWNLDRIVGKTVEYTNNDGRNRAFVVSVAFDENKQSFYFLIYDPEENQFFSRRHSEVKLTQKSINRLSP